MNEVWRSVKDYEGLYEVSNYGRVRNCRTGRVLRPGKNRYDYLYVILCKDGVMKHWSVHRLVGMTFPDLVGWTEDAIGKPFEELQINHKDQNKQNNRVENLEWCTQEYNLNYGTRNERVAKSKTNGKRSKTVYMYLNGKLCGLWPSTHECGRNGFNQSNVAACCRGDKTKYKSFKWSYNPPKPPKALPHYVGVLPCGPSGQGD